MSRPRRARPACPSRSRTPPTRRFQAARPRLPRREPAGSPRRSARRPNGPRGMPWPGRTDSAIVVLQPSTGDILAIANNAQFNDFALTATVPPGSTMKIITSTALINDGLTSEGSPVECPAAYTVQGVTYHNDQGESEPPGTPFSLDFAMSCNNAFDQWWSQLNGQLASTAATYYGLGQPWDIGIPGESNAYFSAPADASGSELAEEAFGQGQLTASPLAMASVAATVDSGQFRQPVLVPGTGTVSASPLPASTDQQLKDMMRDVVTEGTAAGDRPWPQRLRQDRHRRGPGARPAELVDGRLRPGPGRRDRGPGDRRRLRCPGRRLRGQDVLRRLLSATPPGRINVTHPVVGLSRCRAAPGRASITPCFRRPPLIVQ